MYENITEVIGFDLGHGETALTRLRLNALDRHRDPEVIEIYKQKNHITAVGYHPTKGILIGEWALRTPGVTESYITFKRRPNDDSNYKKVMHDFIRAIYDNLTEQGKVEVGKSLFIVGCPSEWTQNKLDELPLVQAYQQIFSHAGITPVTVIPESRAAMMNAIESGMFKLSELKGPVLVIDIGSSTTDFTLVDVKDRKSIPSDVGRDLGASLIDKVILQRTLEKHPTKNELKKILENHLHIQNACELTCRKAKEKYFSAPELYQDAGDYAPGGAESIQSRYIFMPEIDGTVMSEILNTDMVKLDGELKTWPDAFENELKKLSQKLQSSKQNLSPEVILLTGGASRMAFVPELCKKLFPKASVKQDDTPEFSIAKGLARWGRIDIYTSQFIKDIEKFCSETIKPKVASHIDVLYAAVANIVAERVISIIKNNFDSWKNGTYSTINNMKSNIDKDIENLMNISNLKGLFSNQIRQFLTGIANELKDDIQGLEKRYGIPTGYLGGSFDLSTHEIKKISIDHRPHFDATDGITEGVGTIIGWISGILASVVAYIVTPIVLGIIVQIVAIISITLASLIVGILIANPAGLVILAGIGVVGIFAGAKTKEAVERKMPNWNLPQWVRNLVKESSVYSKIDEQRDEIVNQVTSKLKEDPKVRQQLIEKITREFEKSLAEKADDARLLIS